MREWLAYLPEDQSMHCTYCRTYASSENANKSFVKGTTNLKLETIKDHKSSKSHIKCTAIQLAKTGPQKQSVAIKAMFYAFGAVGPNENSIQKRPFDRQKGPTFSGLHLDVQVSELLTGSCVL